MTNIDPFPGQVWERTSRGISEQVHVVRVDGDRVMMRGAQTSWMSRRTLSRLTLVYDPRTAPPARDLHSMCACGHVLLIHRLRDLGACGKRSCGCAAYDGDVLYRDPLDDSVVEVVSPSVERERRAMVDR